MIKLSLLILDWDHAWWNLNCRIWLRLNIDKIRILDFTELWILVRWTLYYISIKHKWLDIHWISYINHSRWRISQKLLELCQKTVINKVCLILKRLDHLINCRLLYKLVILYKYFSDLKSIYSKVLSSIDIIKIAIRTNHCALRPH